MAPSSYNSINLSDTIKKQSLTIARRSIEQSLQGDKNFDFPQDLEPYLQEEGACFVTLEINKQLRGCIGSLEAYQPLSIDIAHNAIAAAFRDPRFKPVTEKELSKIHIHISILTEPYKMDAESEEDLLEQLIPEIDGLIIQEGKRRATFLPSVWEQLPNPQQFLYNLKIKAGFPPSYWSPNIEFYKYHAISIEE